MGKHIQAWWRWLKAHRPRRRPHIVWNITTNMQVRNDEDIRQLSKQVTNELRRYDQRVIRGQR